MAAFVIVVVVGIIVGLFVAFVVQVCPAPTSHHTLCIVLRMLCVCGDDYTRCVALRGNRVHLRNLQYLCYQLGLMTV